MISYIALLKCNAVTLPVFSRPASSSGSYAPSPYLMPHVFGFGFIEARSHYIALSGLELIV